jgi:hypothetical protein
MSNLEASFRLEIRRPATSNSRWVFQLLDRDDRNLSGEEKETYATRREAVNAGKAALQRLLSKPSERRGLQPEQANS